MARGFIFKKSDEGQKHPLIVADIVESEAHKMAITTTTAPVEGGGFVVDNATIKPKELTVTYKNTNAAINPGALPKEAGYKQSLTNVYNLAEEKSLLTVMTGQFLYKNMMIVGISGDNNNGAIGAFTITLQLKEVQQASAVTMTTVKTVKKKTTTKTIKEGVKPTKEVSTIEKYASGDIGVGSYLWGGVKGAF